MWIAIKIAFHLQNLLKTEQIEAIFTFKLELCGFWKKKKSIQIQNNHYKKIIKKIILKIKNN